MSTRTRRAIVSIVDGAVLSARIRLSGVHTRELRRMRRDVIVGKMRDGDPRGAADAVLAAGVPGEIAAALKPSIFASLRVAFVATSKSKGGPQDHPLIEQRSDELAAKAEKLVARTSAKAVRRAAEELAGRNLDDDTIFITLSAAASLTPRQVVTLVKAVDRAGGPGTATVVDRLAVKEKRQRLNVVATTECWKAVGLGQQMAVTELLDRGIIASDHAKIWRVADPDNPRSRHAKYHGLEAAVSEPFHDPDTGRTIQGPPDGVMCRCSIELG